MKLKPSTWATIWIAIAIGGVVIAWAMVPVSVWLALR